MCEMSYAVLAPSFVAHGDFPTLEVLRELSAPLESPLLDRSGMTVALEPASLMEPMEPMAVPELEGDVRSDPGRPAGARPRRILSVRTSFLQSRS
mmetsp:Transcript_38192/g.101079  ORF Transcript_38192/g.101079 Transcript_38192/m.101079 type:complete len:95 (+) Transcript_38192:251-535(+)